MNETPAPPGRRTPTDARLYAISAPEGDSAVVTFEMSSTGHVHEGPDRLLAETSNRAPLRTSPRDDFDLIVAYAADDPARDLRAASAAVPEEHVAERVGLRQIDPSENRHRDPPVRPWSLASFAIRTRCVYSVFTEPLDRARGGAEPHHEVIVTTTAAGATLPAGLWGARAGCVARPRRCRGISRSGQRHGAEAHRPSWQSRESAHRPDRPVPGQHGRPDPSLRRRKQGSCPAPGSARGPAAPGEGMSARAARFETLFPRDRGSSDEGGSQTRLEVAHVRMAEADAVQDRATPRTTRIRDHAQAADAHIRSPDRRALDGATSLGRKPPSGRAGGVEAPGPTPFSRATSDPHPPPFTGSTRARVVRGPSSRLGRRGDHSGSPNGSARVVPSLSAFLFYAWLQPIRRSTAHLCSHACVGVVQHRLYHLIEGLVPFGASAWRT